MIRVSFIGGPFDRCRTGLLHTPPRVIMGGEVYERIDDPDTGEFLGGYAHTGQVKRCVSDE